jgi:hypothetical protein
MTADVGGIARRLGITGVAIALALLSWMSASDRITAKSEQPEKTFFGGDASARVAFARLARNDPRGAQAEAWRSVQTAPVDPVTISALGASALALNRPEQGYAAFTVAGTLGWRDVPTQLYWLAQASAVGDANVLAQRLDALLRLDIDNDAVANALHLLGQTQLGQTALAALLVKNPPWERQFLLGTGDLEGADLDGRIAAIDLAAAHGAPIDCEAVGIAANHVIRGGHGTTAKQLWRRACDRTGDVLLSDGTFETNPSATSYNPFNWQLQSQGGLDVDVQSAPPPLRGHALRIQSSMSASTVAARQLTVLQPGNYGISWVTSLDNGKPDPDTRVLVGCPSEMLTPLVSRAAPRPDNRVAITFSVPAQGCPIQTVVIQKAAGEAQAGWIDDIQITSRHAG